MVHLPNPAEVGTLYKHTAINMKELTNRINVLIEFDKADNERVHTREFKGRDFIGKRYAQRRWLYALQYPCANIPLAKD